MTEGTGIAGAMDHKTPKGNRCFVCGGPVEGGAARAAWGIGVIQACSTACSEDLLWKFAGGNPPYKPE